MIPARFPHATALALALALLVALVVIALIGQSDLGQIGRVIARSQQRQILLADVLSKLDAAEAGQRGYMLSGDSRQLARYQNARQRITPTLERLTAAFSNTDRALMTRTQRPAISQLSRLTHAKLDELAATLALYSSGGPQQAMALMRSDLRSPTMSRLRTAAATLNEAEREIVDQELARARRLRTLSEALLIGIALLDVALLIVAATLLARQAQRRASQTDQLARANEELEQRVRRRTSELSALSNHLQQLSEKEKATLARELHDELGGLLIAVKMDVSWLRKRWPNPAADIEARWARVFKVLDDGVDFKRRVVEILRPTLLDNMGLLPAVRWIVQETCTRAGLQYTELYPEQAPALSDDAAIMLFRLVQESLTNVVKHAHATHVHVQIGVDAQEMTVLVEDNGMGIDAEQREAVGSHGLANMRHRVRSCGGSLSIVSVPQGGTQVLARMPLAGIVQSPYTAASNAGNNVSALSAHAPSARAATAQR